MPTILKTHQFLILALIFAFLNMGAIFSIFGFQKYGDSQEYIDLVNWLQGEDVEVGMARVLRPLGPFFALPFEFLGDGAGFIVQNIIFYLLSTFLIFKITEMVYHDKKQAFFASLFFVTATPVIESGLAYLTDMGAWFFYLLSLLLTLLYLKERKEGLIIINALLSGLGVLMKENGGLGVLFFGLMILLSREFNTKEKIYKIIHFGAFFLMPIMVIQFLTYQYFGYTSLDWYLRNLPGVRGEGIFLSLLRYLGQLFRILGILWIFLFMGLWREWQERCWERIKIYLALIPASFSFLMWSTSGSARTVFIFAPLGLLLASRGLIILCNKLGKKRGAILVMLLLIIILVLNYTFCLFNYQIPFTDIIYTSIFSR